MLLDDRLPTGGRHLPRPSAGAFDDCFFDDFDEIVD